MTQLKRADLLARLDLMTPDEIKRVLVHELTNKPLGLVWEADLIERDRALNSNVVLPELVPAQSKLSEDGTSSNLIIEGDNFDALRLLKTTHAGKIRVILIDPPYNTGNKDWVYNDKFVGKSDLWRHSKWLEFLYQRLSLARDLLTPDGVILVTINDENRARLEMMMDEVFPGRRVGSFVWRTKDTGNDLAQRFSHVHEHILVYANAGFSFNGRPTNRTKFRNPDNDARGDWSPQPLTANKTYLERPNTYYPIQNPETGYWYPCDPNRVWAYASEKAIRDLCGNEEESVQSMLGRLRSETIETMIAKKLIYFPPCEPGDVMRFESKEELLTAIKAGKGPVLPRKKTPLLSEDLPDLDFWVGKPIATGRPSRKEHWTTKPESQRLAPVSSWIVGLNEDTGEEELETFLLNSAKGGVATEEIKVLLGSKAFPYPKPISLMKNLLEQTTRPGDTVLDFFAGSGTTGHAVLELNAEDGGDRSFILCSSKEATAAEPEKNLCLDVTAERIRRVIDGYAKTDGLEGDFAYLKLALVEEADLLFDATGQHAHALVSMREAGRVGVVDDSQAVWLVAAQGNAAIVLCPEFSPQAHTELEAMPYTRLIVYTDRPDSVMELFAETEKNVTAHSLDDVLAYGQTRKGAVPTQGNTLTEVEA